MPMRFTEINRHDMTRTISESEWQEVKQLLVEAKEEIVKLREVVKQSEMEKKALAEKLYQTDRCNFCYDRDFCYKNTCKNWGRSCFPNFIDDEEMSIG